MTPDFQCVIISYRLEMAPTQERRENDMRSIEIGSRVTATATDSDGELAYVIGVLIAMNARYATVELSDGSTVKVGKTKVELAEEPKKAKKVKKPTEDDVDDDGHGRIANEYDYEPVVAASGRASLDAGDKVALELRSKTLEDVYTIVSKILEIPTANLKTKYAHLNPGHQRMCLGNLLRGFYNRS